MSRYLLKMKCYVFSLHSITTLYIGHNSNRGAAFLPQQLGLLIHFSSPRLLTPLIARPRVVHGWLWVYGTVKYTQCIGCMTRCNIHSAMCMCICSPSLICYPGTFHPPPLSTVLTTPSLLSPPPPCLSEMSLQSDILPQPISDRSHLSYK